MGMLTYIPNAIRVASETVPDVMPKGNLPIIKDGFIVADPHYVDGASKFLDGAVFVGKKILKFIADNGVNFDQVFVVVAICGIFVIMAGFRKLGTKLTSGSIVGYIVCKVVSETCK